MINVNGTDYNVEHQFTEDRCIINFDGLFVFVDRTNGVWDLSGQPASKDEETVLKELTASMNDQSVLTVSKDE